MVYIPAGDDGRWVSEDYVRLGELIKQYDNCLELRWIPPEHRTDDEKKPYVVMDLVGNYPVLWANELESPQSILQRIFEADNLKGGNVLDRIDAKDAAAKVFALKAREDEMLAKRDLAVFMLSSPLNFMKHNGVKYDSERRRIS